MPTVNGNGWGSRYVKSDCTWNIWCMGVEDEISSLFAFSRQGMISHRVWSTCWIANSSAQLSVKFFDVLFPHMMVSQASSVDGRLEGGKHWHARLFLLGWTCFFHFSVCLYYCNNICGH